MILPYTPMPVNVKYVASAPNKGGVSQDLYHGTSVEQVDALVDLLMNYDEFARENTSIKALVPAMPPAASAAEAAKKTWTEGKAGRLWSWSDRSDGPILMLSRTPP
jgi:hypothetical protein